MPNALKAKTAHVLKFAIAFTPWLVAMYLFYWLDSSGTWTSETPHRGKISVALLVLGMSLTFLIRSYFTKRER